MLNGITDIKKTSCDFCKLIKEKGISTDFGNKPNNLLISHYDDTYASSSFSTTLKTNKH